MKKGLFLSLGIVWLLLALVVLGCQPSTPEIAPATSLETREAGEAKEAGESDSSPTGAVVSEKEPASDAGDLNDVTILGRQGFNPPELKVAKGSQVVFTNADSKTAVLNFQRGNSLRISISGSIPPGETYTHTFGETGAYTYWTTGYGIEGKITVE